jgi:competence protein ComEC
VVLARLDILPEFIVIGFGKAIDILNYFIAWVASKEVFVFKHISITLAIMLGLYILVAVIIALLKKYSFTRLCIALAGIAVFCTVLVFHKIDAKKSEFIIFHKSRQTLIATYSEGALYLQTEDSLWDYTSDSRIKAYQDKVVIETIRIQPVTNVISFKNQQILVIDSLAVYSLKDYSPDFILLTQSPNINLDRVLMAYPKTSIIADGNNYKSDVDRWKATCLKRKIPFHSTYKKGAFILR